MAAPTTSSGEKVYQVKTVTAEILKSNPPQLSVKADGTTRTSGWKNGRLEARIYIQPPVDGIFVFNFVADPPTGNALQVISPISGANKPFSMPQWVKGVRVVAETNSKQESLGSTDAKTKSFIVIALTAATDKQDCKIVGDDEVYPAIYSRVYGPDTKDNCEKWKAANCK